MSVQPALVAEHDFNLAALVRRELNDSGETDPLVIAEQIIESMSLTDVRLALRATLPGYVRCQIGSMRRAQPTRVGSVRWDNVAQLHADGSLTILRQRVFAQGEWKFLGDCSRDDVTDLVETRELDAAAVLASAARFAALHKAMSHHRVEVVSELPGDALNAIFDA